MSVGPETTTTWADYMREAKGPLVENYPKYSILTDQMTREGLTTTNFDGTSVRVVVERAPKQGTGPASETGTINVARNTDTMKASILLATVTHAIGLSRRVKLVSGNPLTSWADALKREMLRAEEAMPRVVNEMYNGSSDGLLYAITGSTGASGGATQNIAVSFSTSNTAGLGNPYQLYLRRVVDVLVRSGLGTTKLGVRITAVDEPNGTITVTNADGSATSFATDNTMGIYIEGSQAGAANIIQGIQSGAATTGTFENIDKAANPDWAGVDGRNGDTSTADLSVSILDACITRRGRFGSPDRGLWVAQPALLNKYTQSLLTVTRWQGGQETLQTGFKYVEYNGERLFPEYDARANRLAHVPLDDVTVYEASSGPDWDNETGSQMQRFGRSLPTEAWLVDDRQLGIHRCNRFVVADNLRHAA